jgi:predicted anti-sigma-YlaC factor YlaD
LKLSEDLTCAELVELVTDYLEGGLVARDRERFEEHIVFCRGCSNHFEQMRATIVLTGRLTVEEVTPEAEAGLLAAFRGWKERS